MKLDVTLTELSIINCALDDYYGSMVDYYRTSEYYECKEIKSIRDNCPCASCAGEKDVFGNVYKGPPQIKTEDSYIISGIQPVGYYALRPFWADGHSTGIFSFEFLFHLGNELDT